MTKDEPARFLSAFAALMGRGAMIEPSSHAPGHDVKAVVLAAGPGRRLGPLTRELPKTLLPLGEGGTILDLVLANLASVGVEEVAVVTGFAAGRVDALVPELEDRHGLNGCARSSTSAPRIGTTRTRSGSRATPSPTAPCS